MSPDGRQLLTASHDYTVRLWDVETGRQIRVMEGHTSHVKGVTTFYLTESAAFRDRMTTHCGYGTSRPAVSCADSLGRYRGPVCGRRFARRPQCGA